MEKILSWLISIASGGLRYYFASDSSELDTPKPDGLMADGDTTFSEQIFNISVADVELVVEPDGIGDDIRRESMSLLGIHPAILAISVS